MNLSRAVKSTFWVVAGGAALATSVGTSASLTACGETGDCSRLRNDTYAQKLAWGACDPADPYACIKVFGNPRDCTGVLSCDFAVNPHFREQAEQTVLTIAQQSQGCFLCAQPNCVGGDVAYCEPVTRECIIVTALSDAGATIGDTFDSALPPVVEASTPPPEVDAASE